MEAKVKEKALELMQRFNEPTMQWDELDGFIANKIAQVLNKPVEEVFIYQNKQQ